MEFHSTVELGGKTATGIEVPAEVVETLGGGKRPPVTRHGRRAHLPNDGGADGRAVHDPAQCREP